jgi:hypothetical protein
MNDIRGGTRAPVAPYVKAELKWLRRFGYANKNCVTAKPVFAVDLTI